jgi:hypothetical protein
LLTLCARGTARTSRHAVPCKKREMGNEAAWSCFAVRPLGPCSAVAVGISRRRGEGWGAAVQAEAVRNKRSVCT